MPTNKTCEHCAPPGSGVCKECESSQMPDSVCKMCYRSRLCRFCYGTGFEPTTVEKAKSIALWIWVMSWFGLIGGFLFVGFWEYKIELSRGRGSLFSLALLTTTVVLWVVYFVCDGKARRDPGEKKSWESFGLLSTMAGSILAVYTLLGIVFFAFIAPALH